MLRPQITRTCLLQLFRTAFLLISTRWIPFSSCFETLDVRADGSQEFRQQSELPRSLRGKVKEELLEMGSNMNVTGRIVGGEYVGSSERFPYFVALLNSQYSHVCGGSLIAPDAVLTAAHCGELKNFSTNPLLLWYRHRDPSFSLPSFFYVEPVAYDTLLLVSTVQAPDRPMR